MGYNAPDGMAIQSPLPRALNKHNGNKF